MERLIAVAVAAVAVAERLKENLNLKLIIKKIFYNTYSTHVQNTSVYVYRNLDTISKFCVFVSSFLYNVYVINLEELFRSGKIPAEPVWQNLLCCDFQS